jgi:hypothetical protein
MRTPVEPLAVRYGSLGEGGEWREAIEAYYRDEMEAAFALAQALGAGYGGASLRWYRMIEGEALAREASEIRETAPWLKIEGGADDEAVRRACEGVAARLGWDFSEGVLVTVLPPEVDAPWHGARYGYCVDKVPYDKICIRARAAHDPEAVVAHEFAHAVTLNLTQNRAPHWLDEGLAMLMEGDRHRPPTLWQEPDALDRVFEADRRDHDGLMRAEEAYAQAAVLVRTLHRLGGDESLRRLLRAFTNNGLWDEIKINLLGEPSVEEALHEVYGIGRAELFERARP